MGTWCFTGLGHLAVFRQAINGTRLACVRTAGKCDLRAAVFGALGKFGCTFHVDGTAVINRIGLGHKISGGVLRCIASLGEPKNGPDSGLLCIMPQFLLGVITQRVAAFIAGAGQKRGKIKYWEKKKNN